MRRFATTFHFWQSMLAFFQGVQQNCRPPRVCYCYSTSSLDFQRSPGAGDNCTNCR